jgi:hypothetical protein
MRLVCELPAALAQADFLFRQHAALPSKVGPFPVELFHLPAAFVGQHVMLVENGSRIEQVERDLAELAHGRLQPAVGFVALVLPLPLFLLQSRQVLPLRLQSICLPGQLKLFTGHFVFQVANVLLRFGQQDLHGFAALIKFLKFPACELGGQLRPMNGVLSLSGCLPVVVQLLGNVSLLSHETV